MRISDWGSDVCSSDLPASNPWPEVHAELRYLAHDVGMPPLAVIHSATLVGARAAGQEKDMGSIEPGKLANFVVLAADPLANIDNIERIEMTVDRKSTRLNSSH